MNVVLMGLGKPPRDELHTFVKSGPNGDVAAVHRLTIPQACDNFAYGKCYDLIVAWLRETETMFLVEGCNPLLLDPRMISRSAEWLVASLILSFPETTWCFSSISGYGASVEDDRLLDEFRFRNGIQRMGIPCVTDLFDGAGLRDWIRVRMRHDKSGDGADVSYLALRRWTGIALDEEVPYGHLHAYSAYRFGFRAKPLTTMVQANRELRPSPWNTGSDLRIVFEDVYASFPDSQKYGVSKLFSDPDAPSYGFKGRAIEWPLLQRTHHRIFVTSGQHLKSEAGKWMRNRVYISEQKARGKYIRVLFKPYGGMYRLWNGSGLDRKLRWTDETTGRRYRGVAEGYIWPPERASSTDSGSGHSSPGALLQVADHLSTRAEKLWDELGGAGSVEEAVRGAVLATDALELLGCRTPTQSIEALRLKHKFELLAECQFSGVEHHVCIKERIAEIRRDIKAISYWFGPRKRKLAAWNAEAQILTDLVRILREHGHFDEEQYCMTNIRRAMRKIWLHEARPWSFLGYPFRWYVEILLDRPVYFIGALTFWTTALFWFFMHHGHQKATTQGFAPEHGWEASLAETMTTFFQTQTPDGIGWPALLVSSAAILFGFVHLGIFISHLYTQVSRR